MRFKEFLLSEAIIAPWESEDASLEEGIKLLNEHCKNGLKNIKHGDILWRGFNQKDLKVPMMILDSSDSLRTSRDSNNLYQLMIDVSAPMRKYPSRSTSIICSTDYEYAKGFGKLYAIIPFDGTKIAQCDMYDMFDIHLDTPIYVGSVENFGNKMENILTKLGIRPVEYRDVKGKKKQGYMEAAAIDAALAKCTDSELINVFYSYGRSGNTPADIKKFLATLPPNKLFTGLSSMIFTPEVLGMNLVTQGQPLRSQNESWFTGKAVAIEYKVFKKILQRLKEHSIKNVHPKMKQKHLGFDDAY